MHHRRPPRQLLWTDGSHRTAGGYRAHRRYRTHRPRRRYRTHRPHRKHRKHRPYGKHRTNRTHRNYGCNRAPFWSEFVRSSCRELSMVQSWHSDDGAEWKDLPA